MALPPTHGENRQLSIAEQVTGRQKRIQFELILAAEDVPRVLGGLKQHVGGDIFSGIKISMAAAAYSNSQLPCNEVVSGQALQLGHTNPTAMVSNIARTNSAVRCQPAKAQAGHCAAPELPPRFDRARLHRRSDCGNAVRAEHLARRPQS